MCVYNRLTAEINTTVNQLYSNKKLRMLTNIKMVPFYANINMLTKSIFKAILLSGSQLGWGRGAGWGVGLKRIKFLGQKECICNIIPCVKHADLKAISPNVKITSEPKLDNCFVKMVLMYLFAMQEQRTNWWTQQGKKEWEKLRNQHLNLKHTHYHVPNDQWEVAV